MPTYLLDTGILVGYIRGAPYAAHAERVYQFSQPPNITLVSAVSKGEIWSLAFQLGWGNAKGARLAELLKSIPTVEIGSETIIGRYAEIDAFSLGRHRTRPLPGGTSARSMGKNDLWIAATASVLGATLLTTDHDFDHLDPEFLKIAYVDPKSAEL